METLSFRLDSFEGPLDLLLRLIVKNQVDICDIPIALIFDQYMEYIERMRMMDMEIAGEFITMAAELMLIKSRMLLPGREEDEEEDPRAALAQALTEYKKAKEAASYLGGRFDVYSARFVKDTEELTFEEELSGQSIEALEKALARVLGRKELREQSMTDEPGETLTRIVRSRVTPIKERETEIRRMLGERGSMSFDEIMMASLTRSDIIASFVGLLEMVKNQSVYMSAEENGDIYFEMKTSDGGADG